MTDATTLWGPPPVLDAYATDPAAEGARYARELGEWNRVKYA